MPATPPNFTFTVPASQTDTLVSVYFSPAAQPSVPKLAIGTNVPANDPLNGFAAFCDVTRQMTGWYAAGGASGVTYDANGYPASVQGGGFAACWTYLYAYPSGNYTLAWKGPQNGISVQGKSLSGVASDNVGGWTATVSFNTGDRCELRSTGGITAVSLFAPDAKPGKTFRDAYVALLKPYSVLRLMPMQRVNGVGLPPTLHTDLPRVTPAQWSQTTWEVAAEHCAELCREAGCIPWVCVAYGSSDALIKDIAAAFAGFPVSYWEYSNELWNTGPAYQGNQIRSDGVKAGLSTDPNVAGAKLHGQLTAHMASLVKPILPKAKIVLGAQAVWEAWAQNALSAVAPGVVDCLAVAPYFQQADNMPVDTVANVFKACQTWIDTVLAPGLAKNAAVAKSYGCGFIGYESGQSLTPNQANAPPVELQWQADISPTQYAAYRADPMRAAQDDPAIGQLYDNLFAACLNTGMTLVCHFMIVSNWGRSGFWGLKQQTTDADGPKGQALARAIAAALPNASPGASK